MPACAPAPSAPSRCTTPVIVAEFEIEVELRTTAEAHPLSLCQALRARDGKTAAMREYLDARAVAGRYEATAE